MNKLLKTIVITILPLNLLAFNNIKGELTGGVRFIIDEGLAPTFSKGGNCNNKINIGIYRQYNDIALSDANRNNILSCTGNNALYKPVVLVYPLKNVKVVPTLYNKYLSKLVDITQVIDYSKYNNLNTAEKNILMTKISKFDKNNFFLAMSSDLRESYRVNRNNIISFFKNGEFTKIKDPKTISMYEYKLDQIISIADSAAIIWDKNNIFYTNYLEPFRNQIIFNRFGLDENMERSTNYTRTSNSCSSLAYNWYYDEGINENEYDEYDRYYNSVGIVKWWKNWSWSNWSYRRLREFIINEQKNYCISCVKDKNQNSCKKMKPYLNKNSNIGSRSGDRTYNAVKYLISNIEASLNWNNNNAYNKFKEVFSTQLELPIFKYFAYANLSMHKDFLTNNIKELITPNYNNNLNYKGDKSAIIRFTATANIVRNHDISALIYPKIVKFHGIELLSTTDIKNKIEQKNVYESYSSKDVSSSGLSSDEKIPATPSNLEENNCAKYGHKYMLVVTLPFAENFNSAKVKHFYENSFGSYQYNIGCYDERQNKIVKWVKNVTLPNLGSNPIVPVEEVYSDYFKCIKEYFDTKSNLSQINEQAKYCTTMQRTILASMFGSYNNKYIEGFKQRLNINTNNGYIGMYVIGHTLSDEILKDTATNDIDNERKTQLETYKYQGIVNTKERSRIEVNTVNWFKRVKIPVRERNGTINYICDNEFIKSEPTYEGTLNMSTCDNFLVIKMNPQNFNSLELDEFNNDNENNKHTNDNLPEYIDFYGECTEKFVNFKYIFKDNSNNFSNLIAINLENNNITINNKKILPERLVREYLTGSDNTYYSYEYLYDKTKYDSIYITKNIRQLVTGKINDTPIIYEDKLPPITKGGKSYNVYDYFDLGDRSCYGDSENAKVLNRITGKLGL